MSQLFALVLFLMGVIIHSEFDHIAFASNPLHLVLSLHSRDGGMIRVRA